MKSILVDWEGRGYDKDSWEADKRVIKRVLSSGPVWYGYYDVGGMFADKDFSNISEPTLLIETRHGKSAERRGDNLIDALFKGEEEITEEDIEYTEECLSESTHFDSFEEWETWAKEMGILTDEM